MIEENKVKMVSVPKYRIHEDHQFGWTSWKIRMYSPQEGIYEEVSLCELLSEVDAQVILDALNAGTIELTGKVEDEPI